MDETEFQFWSVVFLIGVTGFAIGFLIAIPLSLWH